MYKAKLTSTCTSAKYSETRLYAKFRFTKDIGHCLSREKIKQRIDQVGKYLVSEEKMAYSIGNEEVFLDIFEARGAKIKVYRCRLALGFDVSIRRTGSDLSNLCGVLNLDKLDRFVTGYLDLDKQSNSPKD